MSEIKDNTGRQYNGDHYARLKAASEKKDISEWNDFVRNSLENEKNFEICLEGANLKGAHLESADLEKAHLEGANLKYANLKNARMDEVHLEGADLGAAKMHGVEIAGACLKNASLWGTYLKNVLLIDVHLEGAYLIDAHLEGTEFERTHLEGTHLLQVHIESAKFISIFCDGSTIMKGCFLDEHTDCRGITLDAIQVESSIKQLAKYNNRRLNWRDWYKSHPILQLLLKPFWYFSDYGTSGFRVMKWFLYFSLLFAWIYFCWPETVQGLDEMKEIPIPGYIIAFRALYFSVVTMTTLGFGDIHANPLNFWGHILLMVQVIIGYCILGALVTRLSILFNSDGPSAEFAKRDSKNNSFRNFFNKGKR